MFQMMIFSDKITFTSSSARFVLVIEPYRLIEGVVMPFDVGLLLEPGHGGASRMLGTIAICFAGAGIIRS
jgi:hypothetical protein